MTIREGMLAAYEKIGKTLDFIRYRKRNYQLTFNSPCGQQVLIDLARFCRANEPCYEGDRDRHCIAEGRREVWLRIQRHLQLTSEDLFTLYQGGTVDRLLIEETTDD